MSESEADVRYTERMLPESAHARIFWEHIGRYRFARTFVRGKKILDVACEEGYGAAGLAKAGAASVIGVDVSPEACEAARRKYALDVLIGDAQRIPLPDRSVDVVVSFETIEHVNDPAAFVDECRRVLVPEGKLIVSTPNRPVYSPEGTSNPFHHIEFSQSEFENLLRREFANVRLYSQFPETAAFWSLRSLAAERSPWLRIRGFWRVASWFCPAIRSEVPPATRAATDELIAGRDRVPSSLFNPYLVRPYSERSRERPYVFIAVADGARARPNAGVCMNASRQSGS